MPIKIVAAALEAYVSALAPAFQADDRMHTVGASEIGQCIRKTFWLKNEGDKRLGVERDVGFVDNWGARQRGTVIERALWVPAMRKKFKKRLKHAGRSQKTLSKDFLSATPDGLVFPLLHAESIELGIDDAVCVTTECKTADPRSNLVEAKSENIYQTHVQLGLFRETTEWRPTHALLSYIDASFWSETNEFVIEFDPRIYEQAQERAARIMTDTSLANIPPEGWIAGGAECRYCPFTKACGIDRRRLPFADTPAEQLDKAFVAEATELAMEIRSAEASRDACDAQMRSNQDNLKNLMRDNNCRKIPGIVTWSAVKGRESWDNKAIREAAAQAGVDVTQFNQVGEPTDRLVIHFGPNGPEAEPAAAVSNHERSIEDAKSKSKRDPKTVSRSRTAQSKSSTRSATR